MDSDEVNSIGDSAEAMQIATVVRTVYFDIINRANLPEHYSLINLDASGISTKPVLMTLPTTVAEIKWVKYNKILTAGDPIRMEMVNYLSIEQFLDMMHAQNEDESNIDTFVHTVGPDSFTILYRKDKQPDWYTSFDDNTLIFDSFNQVIESTLQKSNSLCYAKGVIPFTMSDTFTPDLDDAQFALLLNEAKSLAWAELKQSPHQIAERNSRRAWTTAQHKKYATERTTDFERLPDFGRPRRTPFIFNFNRW